MRQIHSLGALRNTGVVCTREVKGISEFEMDNFEVAGYIYNRNPMNQTE